MTLPDAAPIFEYMSTYEIEPDGSGGFQIKVVGPDGERAGGHITAGFPSREAAKAWLDDHLRSLADDLTKGRS